MEKIRYVLAVATLGALLMAAYNPAAREPASDRDVPVAASAVRGW